MNYQDIAPCKCGKPPIVAEDPTDGQWMVGCNDCNLCVWEKTESDAIKDWNDGKAE